MREMVLGQDANFTLEGFIKRYNSDLANDFGNLLNRVSGLMGKYFDSVVPAAGELQTEDHKIREAAEVLGKKVNELIARLRINEAVEEIVQLIRQINKYVEHQAPWKVAKTDLASAGRILYTATEALRISALLLVPVMPGKTKTVLEILGSQGTELAWGGLKPGTKLLTHEALFPRIEAA